MRAIAFGATALILLAGIAQAAGPTCTAQATEKKLAGAALKSFMTKCEGDAKAACATNATGQKLAGAAKSSFEKKCVSDAVGKK